MKRTGFGRAAAIAGIAAIAGGVVAAPTATAAPASVTVAPGSEIAVVQEKTADGRVMASKCTVGFIAVRPDGRRVAMTAGHCGKAGQDVGVPAPGRPNTLQRVGVVAQSSNPPTRIDPETGSAGPADPLAPDWAVVDLQRGTPTAASRGPVQPTRVGVARVGDRVCQQGVTSGWKCGKVRAASATQIHTDIGARQGDSGGPLVRLSDGAALGLTSAGNRDDEPGAGPRVTIYWSIKDALARAGGLKLATAGTPAPGSLVSAPEQSRVYYTLAGTVGRS
ncbi:S1 family peptidase [Tsukamurella sp. 1534]|uniref:S1 family peptidase n=1 Tax=Tsukamurella sp. 1534 TaxID=1151061 RepID=UPI0002E72707|nr:S1 family peptidase [Tsukamurella sp. 1534]